MTSKNRSGLKVTSIEQLDRTRAMVLALPVTAKSRQIPYGYRNALDDPTWFVPIDEHFKYLHDARFKYLKECTYTEVAEWLTEKTGVYISDEGLTKLMHNRPPDRAVILPYEERLDIWRQTMMTHLLPIDSINPGRKTPSKRRIRGKNVYQLAADAMRINVLTEPPSHQ